MGKHILSMCEVDLMATMETAIGIGILAIAEEHLFTFLLSSPFTARNIVKEKNDTKMVMEDLLISFSLSIAFTILLFALTKNLAILIFGIAFAILLMVIYDVRGELA